MARGLVDLSLNSLDAVEGTCDSKDSNQDAGMLIGFFTCRTSLTVGFVMRWLISHWGYNDYMLKT